MVFALYRDAYAYMHINIYASFYIRDRLYNVNPLRKQIKFSVTWTELQEKQPVFFANSMKSNRIVMDVSGDVCCNNCATKQSIK